MDMTEITQKNLLKIRFIPSPTPDERIHKGQFNINICEDWLMGFNKAFVFDNEPHKYYVSPAIFGFLQSTNKDEVGRVQELVKIIHIKKQEINIFKVLYSLLRFHEPE